MKCEMERFSNPATTPPSFHLEEITIATFIAIKIVVADLKFIAEDLLFWFATLSEELEPKEH